MYLKFVTIVLTFLIIWGSCTTQTQSEENNIIINYEESLSFNDFDNLFKKIEFDTLHLYPTIYDNENLILNNNISGFLNYEVDSGLYYPLYKFDMGENMSLKGYIVLFKGILNNTEINLHVYNVVKEEFIFNSPVASYMHLESAFEELKNCWITDLDNDGNKDIAVYYELTDFEMPNEIADNASRSEKYIYYYSTGKYEYMTWDNTLLNNQFNIK